MKKILIILLFCGFWANAQQYHDKGAKFEFATNEGDTITVNTRIPIIDEFGLINYYVDVADLLALNPAPVLEWGNITGTLSNQTDLQGALNDKADQSALTAHTSNGNIHFTQSAISITESQVSDLKDYLRGDINDTNGANKLTLGSLEVVGQTTLQNGLNMSSVPVGTSDNILTLNQSTGDVEQRVFSLGDIDIANAAGVNQFPVGLGDQLRIQGSGDTSISFDGVTNTININSVPGSGTGGAVTSFNGRTGGVVSQAGDYSTAMVNENTNLYFTEGRVRGTDLTGLSVANTPISSTNTFIQALGRLQGQINDRYTQSQSDGRYAMMNNLSANNGQLTISTDDDHNKGLRLINNTTSQSSFFYMDNSDELNINNSTSSSRPVYINKGGSGGLKVGGDITGSNLSGTNTGDQTLSGLGGVPTSRTISAGAHLSGGGNLSSNRIISFVPTVNNWVLDNEGNQRIFLGGTISANGVLFQASASGQELRYRDVNGNTVFRLFDSGFISTNSGASLSGNVTADGFIGSGSQLTGVIINNPSGINTTTGGALDTNDGQIFSHSPSNNNYGGTLPFAYGTVYQFQGSTTGRHFALGHNNNSEDLFIGTWDTNNNPSWNKIWHDGNKRSDSQNDSRYPIMNDVSQNLGQLTIRTDNSNNRGLRLLNNSTNQSSFLYMDDSNELNINNSSSSSRPVYINKGGAGGMKVGGTITATGDVIANSDKRLKKNIKRIDNALAIVQLLGGYEYDRKDIDKHQAGVIAQEVEEVFPTAVSEDEKGIKSVAYNHLIALLIEAVKEQQIEIENLKTLINEK